jgi:hypothetical protein
VTSGIVSQTTYLHPDQVGILPADPEPLREAPPAQPRAARRKTKAVSLRTVRKTGHLSLVQTAPAKAAPKRAKAHMGKPWWWWQPSRRCPRTRGEMIALRECAVAQEILEVIAPHPDTLDAEDDLPGVYAMINEDDEFVVARVDSPVPLLGEPVVPEPLFAVAERSASELIAFIEALPDGENFAGGPSLLDEFGGGHLFIDDDPAVEEGTVLSCQFERKQAAEAARYEPDWGDPDIWGDQQWFQELRRNRRPITI